MASYVDAHCHLDLLPGIHQNPFLENSSGIKSITVTNAPYLYEPNQRLFADSEHIRVALGFHPEVLGDSRILAQDAHQLQLFDSLISEARYIGEVGLDGSSFWHETWSKQVSVLKHIAATCRRSSGKILTVHSRRAVKEVLDLLAPKCLKDNGNQLILHWFSGTKRDLEFAKAAPVYFSVNHRMLRSSNGRQAIAMIPKDKILTETDAPFTFGDGVTTRIESLDETLYNLGLLWKLTPAEAQDVIWGNFRDMLEAK